MNAATLVDLTQKHALETGDRIVYTFLGDDGSETHLTFGELDRRARAIAARLRFQHPAGARALLLYPPGIDYVVGFFGCLYAGIIAVPAYPPMPNRIQATLPRLLAVVSDARAEVVLTTSDIFDMTSFLREGVPELQIAWCATDTLPDALAAAWTPPVIDAGSLAFLQYTSGSTGNPKGVMLSHGNLLANLGFSSSSYGIDASSVIVTWLPPYHDMGLIGTILTAVDTGCRAYLMSPVAFLQKPLRWLEAISKYRATHSAAPNFAYELCVRKVTDAQLAALDLSSWRMSVNGAEPIKPGTIAAFNAKFASAKLSPAVVNASYGLAEATLLVTCSSLSVGHSIARLDKGALEKHVARDGEGVELVSCGAIDRHTTIRIVDPITRRPCANGGVGEIWLQGPSIASGYWEKPEASFETFGARIDGHEDVGAFLRTGDFGFVRDGELFVTGRMKDTMIIRGRNLYPQDVERSADGCAIAHPQIRPGCGAAFSVVENGDEKLVIVVEVERRSASRAVETERRRKPFPYRDGMSSFDANAIGQSIARAIATEHGVAVHRVVLVKPSSLPKTSSGKIQRAACKASFVSSFTDGVLEPIAALGDEQEAVTQVVALPSITETRSVDAIASFLRDRIADALACDASKIALDRPFVELGLDSASAVSLTGELSDFVGVPVAATVVWDCPTIAKLAARYGEGATAAREEKTIVTSHANEPIAIVGMACRFPGADGLDAFLALLEAGTDAIREVPADRWDAKALAGEGPGKSRTPYGGFLDGIDQFDADHFAISRREAAQMDPQQRLLLEVAWHALEDANVAPESIRGTQTGVYVGASSSDYAQLCLRSLDEIDIHTGTGNAHSIAANRLSYLLDLRGPSLAIDTACSSSLVAVHLAVRSLRSGEIDSAIAGAVNVMLSPALTVAFSRARMMAPDGKCKTFDAAADGYTRGEGCGVIVMKRLSDALRDGDRIHAVIRGTATNQDGKSNGLTAPSGDAQREVVRRALDDAGLAPSDVTMIEAHGTGTPLGDPIEVDALGAVLGADRKSPWILGSVKTNIGHLEAAAGIAGLIKAALAVSTSTIFPHLHLGSVNPRIALDRANAIIPTSKRAWPEGSPRIAGVSSFGFGGTNAHAIVEAAPARDAEIAAPGPHVVTISARTETALASLVTSYDASLANGEIDSIGRASRAGRASFAHRIAVVAETASEARQLLAGFRAGKKSELVASGAAGVAKIVFAFTGQGSQHAGMGKELYESEPVFRDVIDACAAVLDRELATPLTTALFTPKSTFLDDTTFTQPALFAIEVALAALWRSWGVTPDVVLGHSVGEIAAAHVAGILSLDDALRLVAARARLMGQLPSGGAMVAVIGPERVIESALADAKIGEENGVAIAAYNAPDSLVLSGPRAEVDRVVEALRGWGVHAQPLVVSHAFHSPLMKPILGAFEAVLRTLSYNRPTTEIISNVTGAPMTDRDLGAEYWLSHALAPVLFRQSVERASQEKAIFVEIGPRPILANLVKKTLGVGAHAIASMAPPRGERASMKIALAKLWAAGASVAAPSASRAKLPSYPFERSRHWLAPLAAKPVATTTTRAKNQDPTRLHPLVDRAIGEGVYGKRFSSENDTVLGQHVVDGVAILPGVAYLEMALAAARFEMRRPMLRLHDVLVSMPCGASDAKVTLTKVDGEPDTLRFVVSSGTQNVVHANGFISAGHDSDASTLPSADLTRAYEHAPLYASYASVGIAYGDFFRLIQRVTTDGTHAIAHLEMSETARGCHGFYLHPALMDASLQTFGVLVSEPGTQKDLYVPFALDDVRVLGELPARVVVHAIRHSEGAPSEVVRGDVTVCAEDGTVLVLIKGFALKKVRRERSIAQLIASQSESPRDHAPARLAEMSKALAPSVAKLRALYGLALYDGFEKKVDAACAGFVVDALRELGFELAKCAGHTVASLAQVASIAPRHARLFGRMIEILVEDGILAFDGDTIALGAVPSAVSSFADLLADYPACEAELTMLERCGNNLAAVVKGTCEPLTLLFPNGSIGAAEALYQDSPFSRFYNTIVEQTVSRAAAKGPIRILEIGGGTGGTTSYVLPKLPANGVEYVFSDVSRMFLGKAEKKFAAYPFVRYEVLDIEKDPTEQGFDAHGFDVIIAANVLHATLDLEATLANAKKLLAADGMLVVLEGVGKIRTLDLVFGLTEGWWRFTDTGFRPDYALVSTDAWKSALAKTGFQAAVTLPESGPRVASQQAVIVATGHTVDTAVVTKKKIVATPKPVIAPVVIARSGSDVERFAVDRILAEVATALAADASSIALDRNFLELGLDSLMAVEIIAKLKSTLGVALSTTVLFEHTSVDALAHHLATAHTAAVEAAMTKAGGPPAPAPVLTPAPTPTPTPTPTLTLTPAKDSGDIAIIGLACRFPNGDSPDEVWKSLMAAKDSIGEIPASRWDTSKVQASKYAALLPRLDAFDALFFEIAPREAKLMDPQQRLMLETVWETLEHAGYAGTKLFGGDVGIFVGSTNTDYFERIKPVLTTDDYAAGLGNKTCIIPNRVSYFMNWRGPSVLVDTACSSSLVALHQAVESLRRGECSYAVAGGVNVLLSPMYYNALNRMGIQAPDGRCKAFDHRANGFATGEGSGALLLKPLAKALADGDTVYAVIKGSAVNHDGKSAGLAAPNPAAHADVIASAYTRAGISPETVSYIEAHGTGTTLGDVIELHGLTEAFRRFTDKKRFCALGSIKTNIGHLEPAAGIAGVIKVVLSMMNKTLPASLHVEAENPKIAWDETPFRVVGKARPWECDGPRRAGVSSFGMGGANAHVVLEEAPVREATTLQSRDAFVIPLSARSDASLRELAGKYRSYLASHPALRIADVAFTAQIGRNHFKHRVAIVARDMKELHDALVRIADAPTLEAANGGAIHVGVVKMRSRADAFVPPGATSKHDADEIALRYARGEEIAFATIWASDAPVRISLPTYAFEKQSHWIDFPEMVPRQGPSVVANQTARPVFAAPSVTSSAKPMVHPFLAKRHS